MQRCPLRWLGISEMPCRWLYNERRYREVYANVKKARDLGIKKWKSYFLMEIQISKVVSWIGK